MTARVVRTQKELQQMQLSEVRDAIAGSLRYLSWVTGSSFSIPIVDCTGLFPNQTSGYGGEFLEMENRAKIMSTCRPVPSKYTNAEYLAVVSAHETMHSVVWQTFGEPTDRVTATPNEGKADLGALSVFTLGHQDRGVELAMRLDALRMNRSGLSGLGMALKFHGTVKWQFEYIQDMYEAMTPSVVMSEFRQTFYHEERYLGYDPHMNGIATALILLVENDMDAERALRTALSRNTAETFQELFRIVENGNDRIENAIKELQVLSEGYPLKPLLRPAELLDVLSSIGAPAAVSPEITITALSS